MRPDRKRMSRPLELTTSSVWPEIAVTATGTSMARSSRRLAVTKISVRSPSLAVVEAASCAKAGVTASARAETVMPVADRMAARADSFIGRVPSCSQFLSPSASGADRMGKAGSSRRIAMKRFRRRRCTIVTGVLRANCNLYTRRIPVRTGRERPLSSGAAHQGHRRAGPMRRALPPDRLPPLRRRCRRSRISGRSHSEARRTARRRG